MSIPKTPSPLNDLPSGGPASPMVTTPAPAAPTVVGGTGFPTGAATVAPRPVRPTTGAPMRTAPAPTAPLTVGGGFPVSKR